nr:MAG: capsid protein [Cressdnaviricota sp.]
MRRGQAKGYTFGSKAAGRAGYLSNLSSKRDAFKAKLSAAAGRGRGTAPGFTQIAAVVRGMGLRGETKSVDIPGGVFNAAFATGNTASQSVTLIQEGAGFWNRIARKSCLKSLQITADIRAAAPLVSSTAELLRLIIFYDKQPNGVAATWNQLVQAYDNAGGITNTVNDGINLDNRDRFVILRDRKITMPGTTATGQPNTPPWGTAVGSAGAKDGSDGGVILKEYIKLNNLETQFNGTANPATVAQINTGNLAYVLQGGTGGQYQMNGSARLRFTDC